MSGKNTGASALLAKRRRFKMPTEGTLLIVFVALFLILTFTTEVFFTTKNIMNLLRQTSINGVVAIGITFVIISGGIDLSVGSVVGFSGMICAILMSEKYYMMNPFLAILIALLASTILGSINGVAIHFGKVPPFIATLGMMTIARGGIMLVSGAAMVAGLPRTFTDFSQAEFLYVPAMVWVWIGVIIIAAFIAKFTRFGRNVYSIGSNVESSWLSGINVGRVTVATYAVCGLFSGIAGIIFTTRIGNGVPTAGQGYELDAIAAAVIGGASLSGAEGTILGTVIGAIIMQMLRNGGNLLGVNPFILEIIIGALIVLTVLFDQMSKARKA